MNQLRKLLDYSQNLRKGLNRFLIIHIINLALLLFQEIFNFF